MSVPLRQSVRMAAYLAKQRLKKREKYPLLVELEPLFACNLGCAGCGKIQYPAHILKQRMPVAQAVAAIEESGAPMVSIAGGEPLIHPEVHVIARELVERRKFVYLCTNALLMRKKLDRFEPSLYFACAVHPVGHPVVLRVRVAAAVLPAGRRLRGDVPRAGRDDRLVEVRPPQRERPVPELHGPLRVRADRGPRHDAFAQGVAPRAGAPVR